MTVNTGNLERLPNLHQNGKTGKQGCCASWKFVREYREFIAFLTFGKTFGTMGIEGTNPQ